MFWLPFKKNNIPLACSALFARMLEKKQDRRMSLDGGMCSSTVQQVSERIDSESRWNKSGNDLPGTDRCLTSRRSIKNEHKGQRSDRGKPFEFANTHSGDERTPLLCITNRLSSHIRQKIWTEMTQSAGAWKARWMEQAWSRLRWRKTRWFNWRRLTCSRQNEPSCLSGFLCPLVVRREGNTFFSIVDEIGASIHPLNDNRFTAAETSPGGN